MEIATTNCAATKMNLLKKKIQNCQRSWQCEIREKILNHCENQFLNLKSATVMMAATCLVRT